jgi:hypothetical protein
VQLQKSSRTLEMQMKLIFDHPLARKIAIVTAVKLLGLLVIWWAFFSEPVGDKLTPDQVGTAILHPTTHDSTTH